jgi:hypothetical protein
MFSRWLKYDDTLKKSEEKFPHSEIRSENELEGQKKPPSSTFKAELHRSLPYEWRSDKA